MQDLLDEAMRGDRDAFEQLIQPHIRSLYRIASAMVGEDEAADVTQDALVSAWSALGQLRRVDRLDSWLRSILMNRARNVLRTRRRHPAIVFDPGSGQGAHLLDEPIAGLSARWAMEDAMSELQPDQRAVIVLHYVADLPLRQVAAALGVRDGTVKSRLNAALKALRREYGEERR